MGTYELFQEYGITYDLTQPEFVCMAAVLNPAQIFTAYYPGVPFSAELNSERWTLKSGSQVASDLDSGAVARLLFGPPGPSNFLPDYLPLPLWLWGLDGV